MLRLQLKEREEEEEKMEIPSTCLEKRGNKIGSFFLPFEIELAGLDF